MSEPEPVKPLSTNCDHRGRGSGLQSPVTGDRGQGDNTGEQPGSRLKRGGRGWVIICMIPEQMALAFTFYNHSLFSFVWKIIKSTIVSV